MSSVVISGDTSGAITLSAPAVAGTNTLTLPAVTATLATLTTPSFATTIGVGGATASASGSGITFPATQSASSDANTLDDYEEGTFSPTIDSATAGTSRATTVYYAVYTKIGNVCEFQIFCNLTTLGSGGSGNMVIRGLPFTAPSSGGNAVSAVSLGYVDSLKANIVSMGCYVQDNTNYVAFQGLPSANVSYSGISFATYAQAGTSLMIAGTYRVA
jgi:hypothetical protein